MNVKSPQFHMVDTLCKLDSVEEYYHVDAGFCEQVLVLAA